jgi:hypothetical protein
MSEMEEINQSLAELLDAATALHDAVEKAEPIIDAIEARWARTFGSGTGRVGRDEHQRAP